MEGGRQGRWRIAQPSPPGPGKLPCVQDARAKEKRRYGRSLHRGPEAEAEGKGGMSKGMGLGMGMGMGTGLGLTLGLGLGP
ncbi:MAG: hypothetical protein M1838_006183 [Thelocarpon superellum]|nr:MAG: hypothetical protein M1838_006183 [Thelocarpon superellum]